MPGPIASIEPVEVSHSSVLLHWTPPAEPNGVIRKYVLQLWEGEGDRQNITPIEFNTSRVALKKRVEVDGVKHNLTIEGLCFYFLICIIYFYGTFTIIEPI